MNDQILQIIIQAKDMASAVMKQVGGAIDNVNAKAGNLAQAGLAKMQSGFEATANVIKTGFLVGMTGAVALLGLVGGQATMGAGQFEVYRSTLTTMLGTQELANKRLQEYADIGAKTPFELDQVVQLGNSLQSLGRYTRENVIMLGDLASASGKPIEQVSGAFAKLASGQKGVAVDMFRDLLITTDDWVKATGKGISKNGELMATTEEMLKVLPKIMADKKFVGMMENQSQTLFGIWSNLMDSIDAKTRVLGEKLLPIIKPYISQLINFINSIDLDSVIENFQAFSLLIKDIFKGEYIEEDSIPMFIYDIAEALGGIEARRQVLPFIRELGVRITELRTAIQPVINRFNELNQNNAITKSILIGLATVIGVLIVGALASMAGAAIATVVAMSPFIAIGVAVGGMYYAFQNQAEVTQFLFDAFNSLWQFIQTNFAPEIETLKVIWDNLVLTFNNVLPWIIALGVQLYVLATQALAMVFYAFEQLRQPLNDFIQAIFNIAQPIVSILFPVLTGLFIIISTVLVPVIQILWAIVVQAFSGILQAVTGVINIISGVLNVFIGVIKGIFTGDFSQAAMGFRQIWQGLVQFVSGIIGFILSPVRGLVDGIRNIFRGIDLAQQGRDAIQGFINGINNMRGDLERRVRDIAGSVTNSIRDALKIRSPSRVMMELGEYTGEGFAVGLDKTQNLVRNSSQSLASVPVNSVEGGSQNTQTTNNNYSPNINIYISGYNQDPKSLANLVLEELSKQTNLSRIGLNTSY